MCLFCVFSSGKKYCLFVVCFYGSLCVLSIWLIVVCFDALFVCCPFCSFVCPPSLSFASTVSPLVVAVSGFLRLLFLYYVWIGPQFVAWKLFVFFPQFLSMLLSKYAFYLLHCVFCSNQKQQDELKQPKQLLFCGLTSHWCKHEELQQLEEGERKFDLWCLDFRTWL